MRQHVSTWVQGQEKENEPRERRNVNNSVRVEFRGGVVESVGEDETAFGILRSVPHVST